jgi:hypothetical protein
MSLLRSVLYAPLDVARQFTTRRVFHAFAKKYDLVYFGYVNQHSDEHELVRGITLSPKHTDSHYCVGHFHGHDITVLERTDTLTFPGKPSSDYRWTILQIDLKATGLPHIFIDANHHDETFYANLFVKFVNFMNANNEFADNTYDRTFAKSFKVYTPPDETDAMKDLITPEVAATLTQHFRHFDFEISGDRLIVYASNAVISLTTLENMLRVGVWLSDHFNQYQPPEALASDD